MIARNGREVTTAEELMEHIYGDCTGWLVAFTGRQARIHDPNARGNVLAGAKQRSFRFPAQAREASEYLSAESEEWRDAYQGVHLYKTAGNRRGDNAVDEVCALWLDEDGGHYPEEGPEPTAIVYSSEGRRHLYWQLARPIPMDLAVDLSRRIAVWSGGDTGKAARATVLRTPGTRNFKRYPKVDDVRGELTGVEPWEPEILEQAIPPAPETSDGHNTAPDPHETPVRLDPDALRVWRGEKPKVKTDGIGELDRSGTLLNIGRVLYDAGANRPVIVAALRERDLALGYEKYTHRADSEAQYHRIVDELERNGRNQRIRSTAGAGTPEEGAPARTGGKPNQMDLVRRYQEREPDVAYGVGSWRRYGRGVWVEIDALEVEKGVLGVIKEAIPEGITPSSNLLSSVVNLLRVEAQVSPHMWSDPERGIIVCQNGTLELEGRRFREHRREDYALFSVAFDYDPDAQAETWEAAFKDRLGGSWAFLQEYAGYSLTTRTDLEAAAFLVGPPGCGKSTFIEGVEMVAGDQAGTLSLSDMERSLYALSNIGGKTLLTATEAPHLYLKSTATLDALISGEKLQIERKYQQPERVRPVAKLLWAMNELPQVRNPSAGLFRRAHIVPFPAVKGKREPLIKELIKMEGSGILNWALDGLGRLNAQRCFSISPEMREATDDFKAGNDVPAAFVEECCKVGPERREESNLLYLKYKEWCLDYAYKPLAPNRVRGEWERLGFVYKKIRGKPHYQGVELEVAPRFIP